MKRLLLVLVACLVTSISNAATTSVNFNGGNGNTTNFDGPSVTGIAGVIRVGGWNNLGTNASAGSIVTDSTGLNPATLSFNVPNVYGATPTGPGTSGGPGDTALMTGYLDNFSNQGTFVTVTGLSSAYTTPGYFVLAYQNSDSAGSWGYSVTSNAITDTRYGQQTGGNGANYPLAGTDGYVLSTSTNPAGPGTSANYVTLGPFFGTDFTLTGLSGATGDGRARLNGFQITSVPEPSSLVMLGLGAACIARCTRRRRAK